MGEDDGRLMVVEVQIQNIARDVGDMKATMADIAKSLSTLAVLEVRHNTVSESLSRAFKMIEINTNKLADIEKKVFASGWIIKVMAGAIGLAGGAVGHIFMSLLRG